MCQGKNCGDNKISADDCVSLVEHVANGKKRSNRGCVTTIELLLEIGVQNSYNYGACAQSSAIIKFNDNHNSTKFEDCDILPITVFFNVSNL